ncbi:MAG: hypothetical protein JWR72_4083, partial [Flavisolibacter sp.]|nr:hypothetical protein [Flavisolibacter sp.]
SVIFIEMFICDCLCGYLFNNLKLELKFKTFAELFFSCRVITWVCCGNYGGLV